MAKITRKVAKIFGANALPGQIGKFGSLAAGSPDFSTDVGVIQSLSNWLGGWYDAVVGENSPAIQDMNAMSYVYGYQIAYLMQQGTPEWNSETTYYIGSIVNVSGVLYRSVADDNLNHTTSDTTYWRPLSSEPVGVGKDFWGATLPAGYVWASGKTIGDASSNATERANVDTLDLFTLFWTDFTDSTLPIYTSAGVLSTRGASAAADWAAHKAISVPDKRGRVSVGKDNLGGTTASRVTSTTMTPNGTTLGAVGGTQTHTLITSEIPSHTHVQDAHNHGVTDPGHTHEVGFTNSNNIFGNGATPISGVQAFSFDSNNPGNSQLTGGRATGVSINNATPTNQNTGGDGAHLNMQPSIICNYIIKL